VTRRQTVVEAGADVLGGRRPGIPRDGRRGTRLQAGHSWSVKWPGLVDCGGGVFRQPYVYRGRCHNRYFDERPCRGCGAAVLQDQRNSRRSDNAFCSGTCRSAHVKAASVGNRTRKVRANGHHVLVRVHDHPRGGRHCQVYEHVLVMEAAVGRYIGRKERVHHINCVKNDNRLENLFLCENETQHFKIHGSLNRCVAALMERGALYFDPDAREYRVRETAP
jgi:hypothetical protein